MKKLVLRILVLTLSAGFGLLLLWAMLALPPAAVNLPAMVNDRLADSGVSHPVTAVLLNFRGYDTLLEVGVLLLAVLGVLTVANRKGLAARARSAGAGAPPLLQALARALAPLMLLTAGYLLWAGAQQPGGAFQAGALLAAAAVLLHLAGLLPAWASPRLALRVALALGFVVFLGVAAVALFQGTLLQYPPAWAGALILLIEATLSLSLGMMLAGLFLLLSEDDGGGDGA